MDCRLGPRGGLESGYAGSARQGSGQPPAFCGPEGDERTKSESTSACARAELRRQIGKLERELAGLVAEGLGRVVVPHRVAAAGPPRVLDLGELEEVRDALADRARRRAPRRSPSAPSSRSANRELLADMLAAPERLPLGPRQPRRRRPARLRPLALAPRPRPARDADGLVAGQGLLWMSDRPRGSRPRPQIRTSAPRRRGAKRRSPSWRSSPGSSAWRSASSARTRR